MIPNVFVSSTIVDLQYFREVLRDALTELSYNPVMSEHGGVGYIHEGSAADACYVTMQQCHIAILIIGKRYGSVGMEGLSVTHKEFHTAQNHEIPIITFVDADVMSFKKVFDADTTSLTWDNFAHMDHPRETFRLIDEVMTSPVYNGLIEFRTAIEAKIRLKQQLAHFMGDRLTGAVRPIRSDVHEILAEVKSIRNMIDQSDKSASPPTTKLADPFYISLRFLLEERNKDYTGFVEAIFGDFDIAAHEIQTAKTIEELINKAGATVEIVSDDFDFRSFWPDQSPPIRKILRMSESFSGKWALTLDKHVILSESMRTRLNDKQSALAAKIK